jgi:HEAT repeat protein
MLPQLLFIVGCGPGGEQPPATSSAQPEVSAAGQESAESEDPQSYAFKMPRPEIGPIPADWQRKTVQEKLRTLDELAVNADFPAAYQQLAHALGDAEPGVREAALARATELPLNLQTALLAQALEDPIANIRYQALDQLKEVEGPEALPVLRQGITSPLEDVKILSANQLTLRGDKPSLEVLFEGLRDPDPKIREEVQENLDFLLSINFRSYHHARQWWAENRAQYDEELFREEG